MDTTPPPFLGTWRLTDWYMDGRGGEPYHPFGPDAQGLLVYTDTGHVSATLMEVARPPLDTPVMETAILKGTLDGTDLTMTPEQVAIASRYFRASAGYMHYSGPFDVTGDVITHHVELSLYPEWIDTDLERTWSFDGDDLVLVGDAGGLVQHLRWERMGSAS